MKIAIFGLGYVGAVTGACLSANGFDVVVIEKDLQKIKLLMSKNSPISEPFLDDLIEKGVTSTKLQATNDTQTGLNGAQLILVCVGTPTRISDGTSDLSAIRAVAVEIAKKLKETTQKVNIAICSTVPPGTTEGVFRETFISTNVPEHLYTLGFIPEFLREGSAIADFQNPTRFIIGVRRPDEASVFLQMRPELAHLAHVVPVEVAEMLKIVENSWHAVKITFANEISRICEPIAVDASLVMNLLTLDTRQNVSATYMRPGFAYGGSCLPKDLRSLNHLAASRDINVPMLSHTALSNEVHIERALQKILTLAPKKVAILGLAFKANTDDMRESPSLKLLSKLVECGVEVGIHDYLIDLNKLRGANLEIWKSNLHLDLVFQGELHAVTRDADLIVVAQYNRDYQYHLQSISQRITILNLVNI